MKSITFRTQFIMNHIVFHCLLFVGILVAIVLGATHLHAQEQSVYVIGDQLSTTVITKTKEQDHSVLSELSGHATVPVRSALPDHVFSPSIVPDSPVPITSTTMPVLHTSPVVHEHEPSGMGLSETLASYPAFDIWFAPYVYNNKANILEWFCSPGNFIMFRSVKEGEWISELFFRDGNASCVSDGPKWKIVVNIEPEEYGDVYKIYTLAVPSIVSEQEFMDHARIDLCTATSLRSIECSKYRDVVQEPEPPSNPTITPNSPALAYTMTWHDNATNETGYRVYRWDRSIGDWVVIQTLGANATSYTDENIECGIGYFYEIEAFNAHGVSSRMRIDAPAIDCPKNIYFIVGGVYDEQNNPVAGVTISTNTGVSVTTGENGTYALDRLEEGTYTVIPSKDGYTFSPHSKNVTVPPNATGKNFTLQPTIPDAPSNPRVVSNSDTSYTLSWNDNAINETGYRVYRWDGEIVDWVELKTLGANATTYTDKDIVCNIAYFYEVEAYNERGKSSRIRLDAPKILCNIKTYTIQGTILDESGEPVSGASVSYGDKDTTTQSNGSYAFNDLLEGEYTITPRLVGYTFLPSSRSMRVPPAQSKQDFTAARINQVPDIEVSPTKLDISLPADRTDTRELTIRNVGTRELAFDIVDDSTSGWEALVFPSMKVDPLLQQGIQSLPESQVQMLVYLDEQADLSQAYSINDWEERGRYVYETLRTTAQQSQADLLDTLDDLEQAGDVTSYHSYFIVNAILVTGNADALTILEPRADIVHIAYARDFSLPRPSLGQNVSLTSVQWNISHIGANRVWTDFGVKGKGVVVANIDTGVMNDHPALVNQYRGTTTSNHDYNWFDPTGKYPTMPGDNQGHGSHTMGTMVGDDGNGNQIGVAPDAQWIAAKGCEQKSCSSDHLLAAAEWILAPYPIGGTSEDGDPAHRPHIVNNSWGSSGGSLLYQASVQAWRAANIFPSFSAGNSGPGKGSVMSPSDNAESFAVGAVDNNDSVAEFSSRGPSSLTDKIKPDVSAPGVNILSSINNGGYRSMSGTSMASPHIAGCAALILSAAPDISVDAIEDVLINTAIDLGNQGPDYTYGYGRIDCYAAVEQARRGTDWLSVNPTSGTLGTEENQDVAVTINTNGLVPGFYTGNILITSNDPDEATIQIPVKLLVSGINFDPNPTLPPPSESSESIITPDEGCTVSNGDIWAIFSKGSVSISTTVTYSQTVIPTIPLDNDLKLFRSFVLGAKEADGKPVTKFPKPFELIFRYGEDVDNPSELTFAFLNKETKEWEPVQTSVDITTKRVIGFPYNLGEFALVRGSFSSSEIKVFLPLIQHSHLKGTSS